MFGCEALGIGGLEGQAFLSKCMYKAWRYRVQSILALIIVRFMAGSQAV